MALHPTHLLAVGKKREAKRKMQRRRKRTRKAYFIKSVTNHLTKIKKRRTTITTTTTRVDRIMTRRKTRTTRTKTMIIMTKDRPRNHQLLQTQGGVIPPQKTARRVKKRLQKPNLNNQYHPRWQQHHPKRQQQHPMRRTKWKRRSL